MKQLPGAMYRQSSYIKPFIFKSNGFSLLETVLSAVMLVVMSLSLYSLFQVNASSSKLANDLDAADRELYANMQEIRRLGASYNWCRGVASVDPKNCGTDSSGNALFEPLTQSYYEQNSPQSGTPFAEACKQDPGSFDESTRSYARSKDPDFAKFNDALLAELVDNNIVNVPNVIKDQVFLEEKATRRLRIVLQKVVSADAFGLQRTVTRYLYLVPEVAKWCPS